MAPSRTRLFPIPLAVLSAGVLLCGCGGDREVVEFSSEVSEEELALGDLLGQGEAGSRSGEAGPGVELPMGDRAADIAADRQSIHFFCPGYSRPFSVVQMRLFQWFVDRAEGPPVKLHDGQDDAEHQKAELLAAIDAGSRGIVLGPVDPVPLREAVDRAVERGIPVVVLGAGRDELPGTVNLPVDYYQAGHLAGEFVIERLRIKARMEGRSDVVGQVIEVTGSEDLQTDLEKKVHAGFSSVIGRYPGVRIVHQAPGLWHLLGGAERAVEGSRIQPGAEVVFCHNDAMAHGAFLAMREEGRTGNFLIVGVDGIGGPDGGIAKVRDQMLGGTVAVPPLARQAAESILALVAGEPVPRFEELKPELVTIANSDEMYRRHMYRPFGETGAEQAASAAGGK